MHPRIDKLRKRLQQLELDGFLVTSLGNIRYLFGFTGSNATAFVTSDSCFFVTDRRYAAQSKEQVQHAVVHIAQKDLIGELKRVEALRPHMRVGFEATNLTVQHYTHLKKTFPDVTFVASERVVENIASVKESSEVEDVKAAGRICRAVIEEVSKLLRPGLSELEVSAELSYRTRIHGSEKDPFEPIVASGFRSAFPHGISSAKKLKEGELVIVDFGAVVNGYAADFTRTLVLGEPIPKYSEMAETVLGALSAAEQACRPGMTGKSLDAVARKYIKQKGYGKFFQHSLGHGLGLEVHGLPRIGETSNDPIQLGQVITLEPGIYVPDLGGVRVEDDFVVTQQGAENLTPFPRELIRVSWD